MSTPYIERLSDSAIANFVWLTPIDPSTSQPVIEPISRPNVDGYSFRKLGKKGTPFRVRCMRNFGSVAAARAAGQHLRDGIVGELCSITTREGTTYTRMMCLEVHEDPVVEALSCSGGLPTDTGTEIYPLGGAPTGSQGVIRFEVIFVHAGFT